MKLKTLFLILLFPGFVFADELVTEGSTSVCHDIFISDSSSTTGAGLTALVFNSGSLTCYYHRSNSATATAITLATMTAGTFASSGFVKIDDTNYPGWYQICPPNAAYATGARSVSIQCKGATNMAPMNLRVILTADAGVNKSKAELSADPGSAAVTIEDQVRWLFQFFHNKGEQTATQRKVYKDDGTTVLTTQTTSDNGTTFTQGEGS